MAINEEKLKALLKTMHEEQGCLLVSVEILRKRLSLNTELLAALMPFAQAYLDTIASGEVWQGAYDRISKDDFDKTIQILAKFTTF